MKMQNNLQQPLNKCLIRTATEYNTVSLKIFQIKSSDDFQYNITSNTSLENRYYVSVQSQVIPGFTLSRTLYFPKLLVFPTSKSPMEADATTKLMSPFRTLNNCGSSSILVRINLPTFVIRVIFHLKGVPSASLNCIKLSFSSSALRTILRKFEKVKFFPAC